MVFQNQYHINDGIIIILVRWVRCYAKIRYSSYTTEFLSKRDRWICSIVGNLIIITNDEWCKSCHDDGLTYELPLLRKYLFRIQIRRISADIPNFMKRERGYVAKLWYLS